MGEGERIIEGNESIFPRSVGGRGGENWRNRGGRSKGKKTSFSLHEGRESFQNITVLQEKEGGEWQKPTKKSRAASLSGCWHWGLRGRGGAANYEVRERIRYY